VRTAGSSSSGAISGSDVTGVVTTAGPSVGLATV
jgi:hypothetical protein